MFNFTTKIEKLSRRKFLSAIGTKTINTTLGAVAISSFSGSTAIATENKREIKQSNCDPITKVANKNYPFYGKHQAGIITPAQKHVYFVVLDLHVTELEAIKNMFKNWTKSAAKLTQGHNVKPYGSNPYVPPEDTGEADDLDANRLTLTFGIAPSFIKKLDLEYLSSSAFVDLPSFPRDQIKNEFTGGDLCIQSCADDPLVAFHAVRQLVREARDIVTMRWGQNGFNSFDSVAQTPRNLFGFRDGTANKETLKNPEELIWTQSPDWLENGSYLVVRKIQMHIETWDRTSLKGQEETFGRSRPSGAPLATISGKDNEFSQPDMDSKNKGQYVIPDISHMRLAKESGLQILRRAFSYSNGIDSKTGQFDAGLLFISFQKDPKQFIGIQSALGRKDKMNEYITHIGSGLFACFGGIRKGEYIGQSLFEQKKNQEQKNA